MLARDITASRWELEAYSRARACSAYCGGRMAVCRALGTYLLYVDPRDTSIVPCLMLDGYWEPWVTLAIARSVRPGFRCVDVGANYGYYSVLMALLAGPSGCVRACEPLPDLHTTYLPRTVVANHLRGVVDIVPCAVGDRNGEAELWYSTLCVGGANIEHLRDGMDESVVVPMQTLDELCRDWPHVDLVKVDVEGAEDRVLRGAVQLLNRSPGAIVLVELHAALDVDRACGVVQYLRAGRWDVRFIDHDGELHPVHDAMIREYPQRHWMLWVTRCVAQQ